MTVTLLPPAGRALPALLLSLVIATTAEAAGYELLASFARPGAQPLAALALAGDGNFYGTTVAGGAEGSGTVFRVGPAGEVVTLASFTGTAGAVPGVAPTAGLAPGADGALYGTTSSGGAGNFGTAFRITMAGVFTPLAAFTGAAGAARGSVPQELARAADGNFYGVTLAGGANGSGTVFQMTPAGAVTTLVDFTGTSGAMEGSAPQGPLAVNGSTLYGVTAAGGAGGFGVIYSVTTAGGYTLMSEFTGPGGAKPGSGAAGGLLLNVDGALYGTTEFGGINGFGTGFKITTGISPVFTPLRAFADPTGSQPVGRLVRGPDAQLYGATAAGGSSGFGTLFKMTTAGTHTVLAQFSGETGTAPGATPRAGLALGADNALYATTSAGGPGQLGVLARITAAGVFSRVAFFSSSLGWSPSGAPVADGAGAMLFPMALGGDGGGGTLLRLPASGQPSLAATLGGGVGATPVGGLAKSGGSFFGVTIAGGTLDRGTAYTFSAATGAVAAANFATSGGIASEGALVPAADGSFYGVSREGGATGRGTIFRITAAGARTRLVSFTGTAGAARGTTPRAPLAVATSGNLYGLTERGGAGDAGTLFQITPAGAWSLVAEFTASGPGPRVPRGGLIPGPDGLLYGTTSAGGAADAGTLVRLTPATNSLDVLADFSPATTGSGPLGALVPGPDGALYGLTGAGGAGGFGTVFRYSATGGIEAVVSFTGNEGSAPGRAEVAESGLTFAGGLGVGDDGQLYGVTAGGGGGGGGTAFRFTLAGPFDAWKQSELGSAAASDLADPEADGVSALVEYAFGLRPSVADASSLPAARRHVFPEGEFLSVTFPRDPAHHDIAIIVEATSTLVGPWTAVATSVNGTSFTGPGYVGGETPGSGVKLVEVRDVVRISDADRRFLRIRVAH